MSTGHEECHENIEFFMEACMEEPMEEERSVEHFDIGTFVLNHRKLCQLVIPLIKWYESLLFVIR